jgi:thiosulfate/3-mercaptopyruvate sulfurtransferase
MSTATSGSVNTGPSRGGPLLDAAELAEARSRADPPQVLDIRWSPLGPPGIVAYRAGHIPGAVFLDLDRDLAGPPGARGRHPLPDARVLTGVLRRAGISAGTDVVVYDEADSTAAARAWWVLRYAGHRRVRALDGGFLAWRAAGLPVSTEEPDMSLGDLTPRAGGMPVLDATGAAATARAGVLLDARTAERYRGDVEPLDPVAGHIPGARSAPTTENVGPDGRFLPPETLRARFAALGVTEGVRVGVYCGSGVTAAHTVLALTVAGLPGALYVGSWSEWIADRSRPVVSGPEPG